jgi:hypothetical protein
MSDSTRVFNIRLARRLPSIQPLQAFRQDARRLLDDMHQKSSGALLGIHATSIRAGPMASSSQFYSEWWQFGAPFGIKLRTHMLLKLLYNRLCFTTEACLTSSRPVKI